MNKKLIQLPETSRPMLSVVAHTEEEFDWARGFDRGIVGVSHMQHIGSHFFTRRYAMWLENAFTGNNLKDKQICLTFDDGPGFSPGFGPGPHTLELARYLFGQGIQATFFVTGKHVEDFPDILYRLRDMGHLVGNHTYDHPHLPVFHKSGANVSDQILRTTTLIRNFVISETNTYFFRPPYGAWSANLARDLNNNLLTALGHVGPVKWNIPGVDDFRGDWECWQQDTDPAKCAALYYDRITKAGKGIILMHDSSDVPWQNKKNLTCAMIQLLVPKLKSAGFQFLRIDADPDISACARKPLRAALQGSNSKWLSPQRDSGGKVLVTGLEPGHQEKLRIIDLGSCRIAIQTPNGFDNTFGEYFTVDERGHATATANSVGELETFDVMMIIDKLAFRSFYGTFLSFDPQNLELKAVQLNPHVSDSLNNEVFGFHNYVE
jgi:peptidoglycan/xylan/chitin deacetylase (PgdA/CDA1 family)